MTGAANSRGGGRRELSSTVPCLFKHQIELPHLLPIGPPIPAPNPNSALIDLCLSPRVAIWIQKNPLHSSPSSSRLHRVYHHASRPNPRLRHEYALKGSMHCCLVNVFTCSPDTGPQRQSGHKAQVSNIAAAKVHLFHFAIRKCNL